MIITNIKVEGFFQTKEEFNEYIKHINNFADIGSYSIIPTNENMIEFYIEYRPKNYNFNNDRKEIKIAI